MKRFIAVQVVLLLALMMSVPANAGHGGEVEGEWVARDRFDGSAMELTVAEIDPDAGLFRVVLGDTLATGGICDPAGPVTVIDGDATYDDGSRVLFVDFDDFSCHEGTVDPDLGTVHIEFEVVVPDRVMRDSSGVTWRRIDG